MQEEGGMKARETLKMYFQKGNYKYQLPESTVHIFITYRWRQLTYYIFLFFNLVTRDYGVFV